MDQRHGGYLRGDRVVWYQARKWGGKQNQPAEFIEFRGKQSARIKVDGEAKERTVQLSSVTPGEKKTYSGGAQSFLNWYVKQERRTDGA